VSKIVNRLAFAIATIGVCASLGGWFRQPSGSQRAGSRRRAGPGPGRLINYHYHHD